MNTIYVNSEIYDMSNEVATSKGKGAQRERRAFVKAIIPFI